MRSSWLLQVVFTLADEKDPNYAWAAKAFAEPGTGGAGGGAGDAAGMASAFSAFGSGEVTLMKCL